MNQVCHNGQFHHGQISQCSQYEEKTWTHMINLTQCPTEPEELHAKMETESKTLSVAGKSEVSIKNSNGFSVFSTLVWSKKVKIPDTIDQSTLCAKMADNIVTITADYKVQKPYSKKPIEQHIPTEKLNYFKLLNTYRVKKIDKK